MCLPTSFHSRGERVGERDGKPGFDVAYNTSIF